jgi:hypothetical protein
MSRPALPQRLAGALDEVRDATAEVLKAASREDADALREAVLHRGLAIEGLMPVMRDLERGLAPDQRRALETEADSLLRQGRDAEAALTSRLGRARDEVVSFEKGAAAVRGYAAPSGAPGGLDHSA